MAATRTRVVAVLGLLALMTVIGLQAVQATPPGGRAIGIWPVALATAALTLTRPPATWLLAPVVAGAGLLTLVVGDRPVDVSVGLALGLGLQALVTWRVLTGGRRGRAPLETSADLARFLLAVGGGGAVMALVGAVTSAVTGWGQPGILALAVGSSGIGAQLTLLPFFCRLRHHPPLGGRVERAAQWASLLAVTLAVFAAPALPSLVMLVLPVLAWGALRSGSYEALAQMAVVVGMSLLFTTYGDGPFSRPDRRFDVPVDAQGIVLATFATVCALVTLALTMTVGDQLENARQAGSERDRVQSIVNSVTATAIVGADLDGRITLFNPGAERLLGYRAAEVLGLSTRVLHSQASVAAKAAELGTAPDFAAVAAALIGAGPVEMEFRRKDGVDRRHQMSLNRVVDDRGHPTGYVSTSEDVTDRLAEEARLVETLETERRAVERLREVDRVKDAFVSSVSHELRTPLTSILGYTEVLVEGGYGPLRPEQVDALVRISANSDRLLSLISELLTLSRLEDQAQEAAQGVPGRRPVDLAEVVVTSLSVLSPTVSRRAVELDVDLPGHRVDVLGDREMLERVVLNLADNAVKFTPDGGRVHVALLEEPGAVVVEVADTGIGVPASEQERLFDRFFRSSLAQEQAIPGSGLGLSIAHSIVERHGGTLEFSSESGVGSTFRVRLPLAEVTV